MEKRYDWKGLLVECEHKYEESYKTKRPNSLYRIQDAVQIDYTKIFKENNFPKNMDYLQIDLEVCNESTIKTLEVLNDTIFDDYKFASITFEHDIYRGNHFNTRERSRKIFLDRGYVLVFRDVTHQGKTYEDWYVHPDLVDMKFVDTIKRENAMDYIKITELIVETRRQH